MVGNDVVDLLDPETRSSHPRFDRRVFAPAERADIAASADPLRLRWTLWAAKEAAYKVARKLDPRTVFSPPRFVVDLAAGEVRFGAQRLRLEIDADRERIHAVASIGDGARIVRGARFVADAAPSAAVRSFARGMLAPLLGVTKDDLDVERAGRIPRLRSGGHPIPVDLSLSHHGRFVAFAAMVTSRT